MKKLLLGAILVSSPMLAMAHPAWLWLGHRSDIQKSGFLGRARASCDY